MQTKFPIKLLPEMITPPDVPITTVGCKKVFRIFLGLMNYTKFEIEEEISNMLENVHKEIDSFNYEIKEIKRAMAEEVSFLKSETREWLATMDLSSIEKAEYIQDQNEIIADIQDEARTKIDLLIGKKNSFKKDKRKWICWYVNYGDSASTMDEWQKANNPIK